MSLAAYLLSAGYGRRLRPLTDRLPKPAITFHGKSALEISKFRIESLAPKRWLVNTHHLPEEMERLAKQLGLETLREPVLLGTGGCLANAEPILREYDAFLVHNADLIHTIDLEDLWRQHKASGAIATLACMFRTAHNTLSCGPNGRLLGVHGFEAFDHAGEMTRLTFTGIGFYQREFLRYVTTGPEDIKRFWTRALQARAPIQLVNCSQEARWFDAGTPQGLWEAAKFVMEAASDFSYNYHPLMSEPKPYVANEAGQDDLPDLLRNVLVCEETEHPIPPGTQNCILGRDFKWDIQA